jgi:hypothetical protein
MLINGTTGAQIGSTINGDNAQDNTCANSMSVPFFELSNGNFVIVSAFDDVDSVSNAGSVMLINGTTGALIATAVGDQANDYLGYSKVFSLSNGNYVIGSGYDDVNGVSNAGSVMLMNGTTGAQIGSTIAGDQANDYLPYTYGAGVFDLGNNNFVISSEYDDVAGVTNAGSVILINGTTGAVIATLAGDTTSDKFGDQSILVLSNGNFIVLSTDEDEGGITDSGTLKTFNGTTGAQIGSTISGAASNDYDSGYPAGWGNASSFTSFNCYPTTCGPTTSLGDYYLLVLPNYDQSGTTNAGYVSIVSY